MVIGSVDVRAGTQEHGCDVWIVPVGRPEKRRRPVRPRGVDIDALFDQRSHGPEVLLRRGADEPQVLTGSRPDAGAQDNRNHRDSNSHDATIGHQVDGAPRKMRNPFHRVVGHVRPITLI